MLISGIVLVGTATTVASAYAMYGHRNHKMIKNKVREAFKVDRRYADIALKAALAANSFAHLECNDDHTIDAASLCSAFACINEVNFEQAWAMAHLVLEACDSRADKKRRRGIGLRRMVAPNDGTTTGSEEATLNFGEFLVATESGQMIDFQRFLAEAPSVAKVNPSVDKAMCERTFAFARKSHKARMSERSSPFMSPREQAQGGTDGGKPEQPSSKGRVDAPAVDSVTEF